MTPERFDEISDIVRRGDLGCGPKSTAIVAELLAVITDRIARSPGFFGLESPCCGALVLARDFNIYADGEGERCPDCGAWCWVSADPEAGVDIICDDDPPDNWPHPYPTDSCGDVYP